MTTPSLPPMDFKLLEFNSRRLSRGAEAARVEVIDGEHTDWMWMSQKDLKANIRLHGAHPELVKALAGYGARV